MTSRLRERVVRMERRYTVETSRVAIPRELIHAVFQAVAVKLGGYPLPDGATHWPDTLADGFARSLGYVDRDVMEAAAEHDPDGWASCLDGTVERLFASLGIESDEDAPEASFRTWAEILNVCAASKVRGHDNLPERDALMAWLDARDVRIAMEAHP